MLRTLRIKNLALVDNLRVEFGPGLNVITGETGAGKSILMTALALLVGERADRALIRAGEDACGAEGVFELADPSEVDGVLEAHGLPPCEEGRLVVRRIVRTTGSSAPTVNDAPVTLQVLKEIGERLVDLHGPHDHQSLLRPEDQREMLDAFGHLWKERAAYEEVFLQLGELRRQRQELEGDEGDLAERLDWLRHRVREIEEAQLREDEEQQIEREHRLAAHAQAVGELCGELLRALTEGETSAFETLAAARRAAEELARRLPETATWRQELEDLARRVQELDREVRRLAAQVDADPARLRWLEERMAVYQRLKKKYGPTLSDVRARLEEARRKLRDLETRDERRAELDRQIAERSGVLQELGLALRARRAEVAQRLSGAVEAELEALGLPGARFQIALREVEPQPAGLDAVEFLFAPNVGEPAQPLRMIASSGEISRVMLALKAVLADQDRIPVLVFDEIDTHVGGRLANAVGRKLSEVARRHQVICLTHLPQVAVRGQHHLAVTKYVRDGRTFTRVDRVEGEKRVEEIARMLGGRDLTQVTLEHARQMLQNA